MGPCTPPYDCPEALGSGGWCGCDCYCCPPCPCYETLRATIKPGTKTSNWIVPPGPPGQGCDCESYTPLRSAELPSLENKFPEFNYDPKDDFVFSIKENEYIDENGDVVYALATGCSIPCEPADIAVDFSGCCMYNAETTTSPTGVTFTFIAVKQGTVSVTAPETSGCGEITVTINGQTTKSLSVNDCTNVTISVIAKTPADADEYTQQCCEFCSEEGSMSLLADCAKSTPIFLKKNITTGLKKTYINKNYIKRKIKKN